MYKVVKQSRAVQCIIILLTLFAMLTVYPLRLWKETIPSVSNQRMAGSSDSVGEDYLLQRFIAQYDHLGTINLYVVDFQNGWDYDQRVDYFLFRMLDSDMQIMFEQQVDVRFIDIPGFCPIYINEDLEVSKDYYFFLQGVKGSRVWFGLEETENAGTPYVSRLIYNYDELEGYNIIGEYNYTVPLRKDKVFRYDMILAAVMAVLVAAVELYVRLTKKERLVTVEYMVRMSLNGLIAAGTAAALWFVSIRRLFSGRWVDNIFYTAGILLAAITLFYLVNQKKERDKYVPLAERWKKNGADYLQAIFFAAAIWACCNYMNGLYEIHHRVAERQLMVFLALSALVMCRKRDIWNRLTLIYAVIAAGGILWYRSIYVDYLAMDEWDLKILRWGMAAVALGGLLAVSILCQILRRRKKRIVRLSIWYGAVIGVFLALLVIFRNTRWWTVAMAVAFALFYIRYAFWDKRAHLLQNICNGLVLNFLGSMLFCFARRPFLAWIYPRYPFIFHTVTVTAVYMAFVMCAAFVVLLGRYMEYWKGNGEHIIKGMGKELLLFGVSGTYMMFTASRTGFLAVGVMMLAVFVLAAADMGKRRIVGVAWLVAAMAVSLAWCFPMIFTAQRLLPAVWGDVYRYEVEEFPDVITRGAEPDSMYFINISRFMEVFNNKIFGIPEGGSNSYERSEEYQRYLAKRYNNKGEVIWEGDIEEMDMEDGAAQTDAADGGNEAENGNVADGGNEAGAGNVADGGNEAENGNEAEGGNAAGAGGTDTVSSGGRTLNIIGTKTEEERAADDAAAAEREKEALEGDFTNDEAEKEEDAGEDMSVYEKTEAYANGRMDIFKAYLGELNLEGHDEMGAVLPDGSLAVHAHNIYLQVAYDHGIIVGIVFVLVGAASFVQGCIYYKKKKEVPCAAMPVAVLTAFAMAGLVEWIFHLCNPAGFLLMLVLAPLLFDMGEKNNGKNAGKARKKSKK